MKKFFIIGSDHAGFDLKEKIKKYFLQQKLEFEDIGPYKYEKNDDYNDYAKKVVTKIKKNKNNKGILICGTGQGMSVQANRYKGIRAVLCWNKATAQHAKKHLNANIITLPGKSLIYNQAKELIKVWIDCKQIKKKKYIRRIEKLDW